MIQFVSMRYKIQVTIQHNGRFFEAIFERNDDQGVAVCRHIFGSEPSDPEIYEFILHHYHQLKFSTPLQFELVIKRKKFKRMMREVKKEMSKPREHRETRSHELLREEMEKNKKTRKKISKKQKQQAIEDKFQLKQLKRKQKHRGH